MIKYLNLVGSIAGTLITLVTFVTLVCKPMRKFIIGIIVKSAKTEETEKQLAEVKSILERNQGDMEEFKAMVLSDLATQKEFAKTQLRNLIKNLYYHYRDARTLPEYEYKTLLTAYELYHALGGNSFATKLYEIMVTWDIDPDRDSED